MVGFFFPSVIWNRVYCTWKNTCSYRGKNRSMLRAESCMGPILATLTRQFIHFWTQPVHVRLQLCLAPDNHELEITNQVKIKNKTQPHQTSFFLISPSSFTCGPPTPSAGLCSKVSRRQRLQNNDCIIHNGSKMIFCQQSRCWRWLSVYTAQCTALCNLSSANIGSISDSDLHTLLTYSRTIEPIPACKPGKHPWQ